MAFRVALISPPLAGIYSPPLALPSLTAYLRRAGIEVLQIDASIEAVHYLFEPEHLNNRLSQAIRYLDQSGITVPLRDQIPAYADYVTGLWHEDGFRLEPKLFDTQIQCLDFIFRLSSIVFQPTQLSLGSLASDDSLVIDKSRNPFLEYYLEKLIPAIQDFGPDMIGISCGYSYQVNPAISLAAELRQAGMTQPFVIGGSYVTEMCDTVLTKTDPCSSGTVDLGIAGGESAPEMIRQLDKLVDPFGIVGEGEEALLQLCVQLGSRQDPSRIPNLIHRHRGEKILHVNDRSDTLKGDGLPIPDLKGLPLGRKYLTPVPLAPLMTSRGCYWDRCTFCSHAQTLDMKYRRIPSDLVFETMKNYQSQYAIKGVLFCDEALPTAMLKKLTEKLQKDRLNVIFGSMARFEEPLVDLIESAAAVGLGFLSFGLESGSPRIIEKMKKGYRHDTASAILKACHRSGMMTECHIMFGFPTETQEEALETIRFLEAHASEISFIRANPWIYFSTCPIGQNPDAYGIKPTSSEALSSDSRSYKLVEGISHQEACGFVKKLSTHPDFKDKVVQDYRNEEYFLIRYITENDRIRNSVHEPLQTPAFSG